MRTTLRLTVVPMVAILLSPMAGAVTLKERGDPLDSLVRSDERLQTANAVEPLEDVLSVITAQARQGWADFREALGASGVQGEWEAYADRSSGYIGFIEGTGIPWIPGHGNRLDEAAIAAHLGDRQEVDLVVLERIARAFLPQVAPALGVDPRSLVLSRGRSGRLDEGAWFVDFDVYRGGLPIEGARLVFRINSGNLTQLGTENLPPLDVEAPAMRISREQARAVVDEYIGGLRDSDTVQDHGSLHLLPAVAREGNGRGLLLVWQLVFRREGVMGTWRARVDATSGELLDFEDVNRYAKATGGVYLTSYVSGDETVMPMPFADAGSAFTTSAGHYSFPGGTVKSTLNGSFVWIDDFCGPISLEADPVGDLAFGTSPGTDCAAASPGGGGNTHAARTQFYFINRAKESGRAWLPDNDWLKKKLTVKVNLTGDCNAYASPSGLEFYQAFKDKDKDCNNTGEIAGISLHEYGHALDDEDGNGRSPDSGTGEAYGDFTATLLTRDSCIGFGFYKTNCTGYGDACTACTGVRDIDWDKHASKTPHTVANFTQVCTLAECGGSGGPCGREPHFESHIVTEALWDFVARDLPDPGSNAAWAIAERLWYRSRKTAGSAFTCDRTPKIWTSNGCGTGSLWTVMRFHDDDDGNLANSTPHSAALFAAFDRHGIACGSAPVSSTCTPPAVPTLDAKAGDNTVDLSWISSGAGVVYDVYRSEMGCKAGFVKLTAAPVAGTSYADEVTNGQTYSYQIIAFTPGKEACSSAPSECQSATPPEPADVWSRDNDADGGSVPSSGDMWKSEDIWVRTDTTAGPHQNPEAGQTNYIHVQVSNRGKTTAHNIHVRVYVAKTATGLAWPEDWTPVGTGSIARLPGSSKVDPAAEVVVPWKPEEAGHFCLLARLVTAQDPMTTAEVADVDANTRNNNNIVSKNVNIVDLVSPAPIVAPFIVRNPSTEAGIFRLRFSESGPLQGVLLDRVKITILLGRKLHQLWVAAGRKSSGVKELSGYRLQFFDLALAAIELPLAAREEFTPCLFFELDPDALGLPPATFLFDVIQDEVGATVDRTVGGITYRLNTGINFDALHIAGTNAVAGDFSAGGLVTYTLVLRNSGPGVQPDNPGDELVDVLPPQLELVSAKASSGRTSMQDDTVRWNGAIPAGRSITLTIRARIRVGAEGEIVSSQATIAFDADGDGTNDSTTATDDPATAAVGDATDFLVQETVIPIAQ